MLTLSDENLLCGQECKGLAVLLRNLAIRQSNLVHDIA